MYNRRYKTKTLTNHPINKIIKAIEALTVFQTTITTSLSLFKESEHGSNTKIKIKHGGQQHVTPSIVSSFISLIASC